MACVLQEACRPLRGLPAAPSGNRLPPGRRGFAASLPHSAPSGPASKAGTSLA
jgi:hypothetical protein